MALDAADLALIEAELLQLPNDGLSQGIQALVDEIRHLRLENERACGFLKEAREKAKDGQTALERLRDALHTVEANLPDAVWKFEDEADDCFLDIRTLDEP